MLFLTPWILPSAAGGLDFEPPEAIKSSFSDGIDLVTTPDAQFGLVWLIALYVPWFRYLEHLCDVTPQVHADNLRVATNVTLLI